MPDCIETLLVVAAENEVTAVGALFDAGDVQDASDGSLYRISSSVWVLQTGIGKANAAARVARVLARNTVKRVVNLGIAGALPGSGLELGQTILASKSVFADEGVETTNGFLDCRAMGFPLYKGDDSTGLLPSQHLRERLHGLVSVEVVIATVSTCSGRDDLATRIRRRTGAGAECMEGAAVMLACRHANVPAAEIRVISNTTGDRESQEWAIRPAMTRLGEIAKQISDIDFG